jgi:polyhydroxyalkanoate synthase
VGRLPHLPARRIGPQCRRDQPAFANKHGFWINPDMPETAEAWLDSASRNEGSWWPHWQGWLARDQERVPARVPGDSGLPVIEPAPGSYVRMKG